MNSERTVPTEEERWLEASRGLLGSEWEKQPGGRGGLGPVTWREAAGSSARQQHQIKLLFFFFLSKLIQFFIKERRKLQVWGI